MMSGPQENEVRQLLSKAWGRRRRQMASPSLQDAQHLDLNREFEESSGGGIKYFFVVLALLTLLIFALGRTIGLN